MYESRSNKKKTSSRMSQKKRRQNSERAKGENKSKKQEEKPKKFQFIHSLNKYNIRYGVFMYIIHFQRNAQSTNELWCEKSL